MDQVLYSSRGPCAELGRRRNKRVIVRAAEDGGTDWAREQLVEFVRRIRDTLWLKPRNGGGFYNFFEKLKKNTANLSDDHFFCIYSYWKYLPTFLKLYIKLKLKYDLKLKLDFKLTYDFKLKLLATFFSI